MNPSKTIKIKLFLFLLLVGNASPSFSAITLEMILEDWGHDLPDVNVHGQTVKPFHDSIEIFQQFYHSPPEGDIDGNVKKAVEDAYARWQQAEHARPHREEEVDQKQVQAELIAASITGLLKECSEKLEGGTVTYGAAKADPVDGEALMKMHGEGTSLLNLFEGSPDDQLSQLLWVYAHAAQKKPIFFQDPSGHFRSLTLPPEAANLMEPYINHALLEVFLPRLKPHQTTSAILNQILNPMNWIKAATNLEGKTLHQRLQDATREEENGDSAALTIYSPATNGHRGLSTSQGVFAGAVLGSVAALIAVNFDRIAAALSKTRG